jgi:hypothetical protein
MEMQAEMDPFSIPLFLLRLLHTLILKLGRLGNEILRFLTSTC